MFYRYTVYWFNESIYYEDSITLANKTLYKLSIILMGEAVKGVDCDERYFIDCLKTIMHETLRDDYLSFKDSSGRICISDGYIEDIYHLLEIFKLTEKVKAYNFSFCKRKLSNPKNISDIRDDLNRYITRFGDKDSVKGSELCSILNITKTTLSTWIKKGVVVTYKQAGKAYYYKLSDVLQDLKKG